MEDEIVVSKAVSEGLPFWPSPQDYNEALQNPATAFADEDLRSALAVCDKLGLPRAVSGNFASVYELLSGDKRYALRCFF